MDDHTLLRTFKCLQKSYYEFSRLRYDLSHDEATIMLGIFRKGGFACFKVEECKIQMNPVVSKLNNLLPTTQRTFSAKLNSRLGRVPFGYRKLKTGIVRLDVNDSKVVKAIFELFNKSKSIPKVRIMLNDSGMGNLDYKVIIKILNNYFYAGSFKVNGVEMDAQGAIPVIIEKQTYLKAQENIKFLKLERKITNTFLLSRFVTRKGSNRYYCGFVVRKKSGLKLFYYGCNRNKIGHHTIRADRFEDLFEKYLMGIIKKSKRDGRVCYFDAVYESIEETILRFTRIVATMCEAWDDQNAKSERQGTIGNWVEINPFLDLVESLKFFSSRSNYTQYGEGLVDNAKTLWHNSDKELKREIHFAFFPYGVSFDSANGQFHEAVVLGNTKKINVNEQNPSFTF